MRLIHFAEKPITELRAITPAHSHAPGKPTGLWVSDEDKQGWSEWCQRESFGLDRLTHAHAVTLAKNADILMLHGAGDLDAFDEEFGIQPEPRLPFIRTIDWLRVAEHYDGILITPYIYARRLNGRASRWYYGWDCASGCIWNTTRAIEKIEVIPFELKAAAD